MLPRTPHAILGLAAAASLGACTLNVDHYTEEVTASWDLPTEMSLRVVPDPADYLIVSAHDEAQIDASLEVGSFVRGYIHDVEILFEEVDSDWVEVSPYRPAAIDSVDLETFTVEAPMPAGVDVISTSTSLEVIGFCGPVRVQGGSCDVMVDALGAVEIDVGSGTVDVFAELGSVYTGSGDITADFAGSGSLETESGTVYAVFGGAGQVSTGSGDVFASFGGAGQVSTGSGTVEVEITDPDFGELFIDVGSGDVDVRLPAGADPIIDIDTGSGDVEVAPGLTYSLGGGLSDPSRGFIRIDTGSGDVTVSF